MWLAFTRLFHEGGWVLFPIFGVSVLAWYLGFGKILLFRRVARARRRFSAKSPSAAPGYDLYDRLAERLARVKTVQAGAAAYMAFEEALIRRVDAGFSTMVACAVIAPLLGLVGTISGMNEMFSVIGAFGFGSPTILSHGISIALLATLTGLGVAVGIIFFQNYLQNAKGRLIDRVREDRKRLYGAEVMNKEPEEKGDFMSVDYRLVPEENERPDINLAPFVDIIMILLIFFVVTANLYVETGVDVSKPKATAAKPVSSKAVLIGVTREGTIHLYGRQVSLERLRIMLEQEAAKQPDLSVVIIADREAVVGKAVQVMDQCALAGVQKISVAAGKE